MARKLTKSQETLLRTVSDNIISYDDLPKLVSEKLVRMNDYESLWSDVDRFLWDKAMDARYKK